MQVSLYRLIASWFLIRENKVETSYLMVFYFKASAEQVECGETYRPLRVQQDVGELQHQSVGRLVVRLLQGVGQQLRARRLDDHLTVTSSTGDQHPGTQRQQVTPCQHINREHISQQHPESDEEVDKSEKIQGSPADMHQEMPRIYSTETVDISLCLQEPE